MEFILFSIEYFLYIMGREKKKKNFLQNLNYHFLVSPLQMSPRQSDPEAHRLVS